jgi:hypothetical protein
VTPERAVSEAFDEIKSGGIGHVTDLDQARAVMTALGMSEEDQEQRIHFAFTGEVVGG